MKINREIIDIIENNNVLVGVSGGVDSVVLLHILEKLKKKYNFNIEIAHFNHVTREGESDIDEKFVRDISEKLNIKFQSERKSMSEFSRKNKISEEEAGRILRHKFFEKILNSKSSSEKWYLALAHNLDDQVETIFMRIFRGTGIKGLAGMNQIDDKIIRPLLNFTKEEILKYAIDNKLSYHQDYTNYENIFTRNSIRNELIPIIKEKYSKNIYDVIIKLSEYSVEYNNYIENTIIDKIKNYEIAYTSNFTKIYKKDILKLSNFEKRIFLRREIDRLNKSNYDFTKNHYNEICKIIESTKGVDVVINNIIFYNSFDYFVIRKYYESNKSIEFIVAEDVIRFNNFDIIFSKKNKDSTSLRLNLGDKINIRVRKNGDKILVKGKQKKLKDFLIDKKIDKFERDIIPIIELNGEIIMVSNLYKRNYCNNGEIEVNIKEK